MAGTRIARTRPILRLITHYSLLITHYSLLITLLVLSTRGANPYAAWVAAGRPLGLSEGALRVGIDASYPPLAVDGVDGPGGFEVDLAREIAKRLGVELALENTDVGGGLDALLADRYDMILAGLTPAPDLRKRYAFSRPYFDDGPIALRRGEACAASANLAGLAVGTELGSDGDLAARQALGGRPDVRLRRFGDRETLFAALGAGEIDAAVLDGTSARLARREHPGLCLASAPLRSRPLAIALQLRKAGLRFAVDDVLVELATSGWLAALERKWMG